MGMNATVVVLTDALSWIEEDPEFGKKLAKAIRTVQGKTPLQGDTETMVSARSKGGGVHCNAAKVISHFHADIMQVVAIGGNTGRLLGLGCYSDDDERLLKDANRQARERRKRFADP